jgi:hypothetical protein
MKTNSFKTALVRVLLALWLVALAAPFTPVTGAQITDQNLAHPMDGWDPPSVPL